MENYEFEHGSFEFKVHYIFHSTVPATVLISFIILSGSTIFFFTSEEGLKSDLEIIIS